MEEKRYIISQLVNEIINCKEYNNERLEKIITLILELNNDKLIEYDMDNFNEENITKNMELIFKPPTV